MAPGLPLISSAMPSLPCRSACSWVLPPASLPLGLLALTMLLQVYVAPAMWWSLHVYWVSILMVLVLFGPGAISIDALIRTIYRRDRRLARG